MVIRFPRLFLFFYQGQSLHYRLYSIERRKSLTIRSKFSKTLNRIDDRIDFWLFKMPPSFKYSLENLETVRNFFNKNKLDNNESVIEFRDQSWWKVIDKIENIGIVFCSVDAPQLPHTGVVTNDSIYLRIHGYKKWYNYIYSQTELDTLLSSIKKLNVKKKTVYQ